MSWWDSAGDLASGAGSLTHDILGGVGDYYKQERYLDAVKAKKDAENKAFGIGDDYYKMLEGQYGPEAASYMSDLNKWRTQQGERMPEYQEFDKSGYTVDKYLDPSMKYQQEQAAKAVQQSAAAQGGLMSGATGKALQDRATNLAQQDYGNAFERMQGERQFGYNDYLKKFDTSRENEGIYREGLGNILKQSGSARDNLLQSRGGRADLGMGHEKELGGLESTRHQLRGDYLSGQLNRAGNASENLIKSGTSAAKSLFAPTKVG
jgi:hypothetical protein